MPIASLEDVGEGADAAPATRRVHRSSIRPRTPEEAPPTVVLPWVYEYLLMSGDEAAARAPEKARRMEFLQRVLASPTPEVREYVRAPARGLAEFEFRVGRVTDIGGGGLAISTSRPLDVGTKTNIRVTDPDTGICYNFPCVVVWARGGEDAGIGVRFCGRPSRDRVVS